MSELREYTEEELRWARYDHHPVFPENFYEELRETHSYLDYSIEEDEHINVRLCYINIEYGKLLEELTLIREYAKARNSGEL